MTPDQIKIVQTHFVLLYPVKYELSKTFYDRLFEIAPEARPMFPENMALQREKLADTLAFVVKNLSNSALLESAVRDLAIRHRGYGAKAEHLAPVGEALIYALEAETAGGLMPKERKAWLTAYATIADAMTPVLQENAA